MFGARLFDLFIYVYLRLFIYLLKWQSPKKYF